jgi:transposase
MSFIEEGVSRGASKDAICTQFGLSSKTLKRWQKAGPDAVDGRKGPTKAPKHKLSPEERAEVIDVANSEEFRNLSPRQIVPRLADEGRYLASESTFYRVLREEGLLVHRGHRKAPVSRKPDEHRASGPNQVWSWDITYLQTQVRGQFFYLYMAVDVWSRKIVGFRVERREDSELSKELLTKAIAAQGAVPANLVIHAPGFPRKPFTSLEDAIAWVERFVRGYNFEHLHSGIRFVTPESPESRHERRDVAILAKRAKVCAAAKTANPRRWTGPTRNWTPIGDVVLNPIRDLSRTMPLASAAE